MVTNNLNVSTVLSAANASTSIIANTDNDSLLQVYQRRRDGGGWSDGHVDPDTLRKELKPGTI
jgi:hypothetical protein